MMMEGKKSPVAAAMAQFLAALKEGDAASLKGGAPMKVEIEAGGESGGEAMGECEACKAGACDDPEHMKSEDMEGLAEAYR